MNSRWMHVAMAMAALTTGCAVGEAGAEDIDMDDAEAEAVEVEETSQALFGYQPRDCSGSWGRGPSWGSLPSYPPVYDGWGSKPWSPWSNSWKPYGNYGYGDYGYGNPFSYGNPYRPWSGYNNGGYGNSGSFAPAGCSGYNRPY
ncbi:hypothetical protein WME76_18070 [Sorangium sp. So ce119]|uniref:hypothetical protein n=1 Tax=Sorangium sp. So ce119 TaxID=3133279 RepID=UPI003F5F3367